VQPNDLSLDRRSRGPSRTSKRVRLLLSNRNRRHGEGEPSYGYGVAAHQGVTLSHLVAGCGVRTGDLALERWFGYRVPNELSPLSIPIPPLKAGEPRARGPCRRRERRGRRAYWGCRSRRRSGGGACPRRRSEGQPPPARRHPPSSAHLNAVNPHYKLIFLCDNYRD
jgi:hypothetical protein